MEAEKNIWEQNIALWEKWTSNYTDTMFKAMEKTLDQSTLFRGQVDKAVSAAMSTQFEMTLVSLKALERQVEGLSAKVDKLVQEKK
ncbi:MAG: hypothetical protein HY782_09930 [Chloroflexi bacterium]|nr:hypothetical protein [Chloroflexota bacterium]